jgi:hypothetical protein
VARRRLQLSKAQIEVNFYGTLNLHTGQEIVMPSEVMNAAATARHLEQILQAISEAPILLLKAYAF